VIDDPARLPKAALVLPVPAPRPGFLTSIDGYAIGEAVVALGGGRRTKEDAIDPSVGVVLEKKTGDRVAAGETLAHLHVSKAPDSGLLDAVTDAFVVAPGAPAEARLVLERFSSS
jgi:thymidine phosphorylase